MLRELKTLESGSELYKQALAELARAPRASCSGTSGVFVDASVDPETLTHSKAALATALVRQGLVAEAMRGGGDGLPLLRGVTAQTLAGVAGEEQVIVFGERVWCLRQLARTLRERHGVEAHVADGSVDTARVRGAQAAVHRRRVPGAVPVAHRSGGPQPPERVGARATSICPGCRPVSSILLLESLSRPCLTVGWLPVLKFSKRPGRRRTE